MLDKEICFRCAKECGRFNPASEGGIQYTVEKFRSDWKAGLVVCSNRRVTFIEFCHNPPVWCEYAVEQVMKIGFCTK
jgi:hypothetical protein